MTTGFRRGLDIGRAAHPLAIIGRQAREWLVLVASVSAIVAATLLSLSGPP